MPPLNSALVDCPAFAPTPSWADTDDSNDQKRRKKGGKKHAFMEFMKQRRNELRDTEGRTFSSWEAVSDAVAHEWEAMSKEDKENWKDIASSSDEFQPEEEQGSPYKVLPPAPFIILPPAHDTRQQLGKALKKEKKPWKPLEDSQAAKRAVRFAEGPVAPQRPPFRMKPVFKSIEEETGFEEEKEDLSIDFNNDVAPPLENVGIEQEEESNSIAMPPLEFASEETECTEETNDSTEETESTSEGEYDCEETESVESVITVIEQEKAEPVSTESRNLDTKPLLPMTLNVAVDELDMLSEMSHASLSISEKEMAVSKEDLSVTEEEMITSEKLPESPVSNKEEAKPVSEESTGTSETRSEEEDPSSDMMTISVALFQEMFHRFSSLQSEVQELKMEVIGLRSEVLDLKALVGELKNALKTN